MCAVSRQRLVQSERALPGLKGACLVGLGDKRGDGWLVAGRNLGLGWWSESSVPEERGRDRSGAFPPPTGNVGKGGGKVKRRQFLAGGRREPMELPSKAWQEVPSAVGDFARYEMEDAGEHAIPVGQEPSREQAESRVEERRKSFPARDVKEPNGAWAAAAEEDAPGGDELRAQELGCGSSPLRQSFARLQRTVQRWNTCVARQAEETEARARKLVAKAGSVETCRRVQRGNQTAEEISEREKPLPCPAPEPGGGATGAARPLGEASQ